MVQSELLKKTALGKGFHLKPHFQLTIIINYRQTTKKEATCCESFLAGWLWRELGWFAGAGNEAASTFACSQRSVWICTPSLEMFLTSLQTQRLSIKLTQLLQCQCFPFIWITWADKAVRTNNYPLLLFIQQHNLEPFPHFGGKIDVTWILSLPRWAPRP